MGLQCEGVDRSWKLWLRRDIVYFSTDVWHVAVFVQLAQQAPPVPLSATPQTRSGVFNLSDWLDLGRARLLCEVNRTTESLDKKDEGVKVHSKKRNGIQTIKVSPANLWPWCSSLEDVEHIIMHCGKYSSVSETLSTWGKGRDGV